MHVHNKYRGSHINYIYAVTVYMRILRCLWLTVKYTDQYLSTDLDFIETVRQQVPVTSQRRLDLYDVTEKS